MLTPLRNKVYSSLRRSESFFKTDMVYLAKGSAWSIIGQFSASFLSFLLVIAMAYYVSKETYGNYKYIISIVSILMTFSLSGLGSAVLQSVANGFEGSLKTGFWMNLRWSIGIFLGAFIIAAYYFINDNTMLAYGILAGGCLSPFLVSANLSQSYLAAKSDFRRLNIYFNIIENIFPITSLLITILLTQNPAIIATIYFLSNTLTTLFLYRRITQIYKPLNNKKDPGLFSYSSHLSAMNLLSGISNNIDQILLFQFIGAAELAIYNFAIAIPDQMKGVFKNLDIMMQARFAEKKEEIIFKGLFNKVYWLIFFTLLLFIIYLFTAPIIFEIFFPKYSESIPYSQLYALSFLTFITYPISSFLTSKKKIEAQYFVTTTNNIIKILSAFIGIILWGLWGVIIARVFSRTFSNVILYTAFKLNQKRDEKNIM